jgi:hypothetical protein
MPKIQKEIEKGVDKIGDAVPRELFQCFCGQRFGDRDSIDKHLGQFHPEMLVKCDDCGRLLPKGSWQKAEGQNLLVLVPSS